MHPTRRMVLVVVAASTVFTAVFGFAASLSVTSTGLGVGTASVASCDTNGVSTDYSVAYEQAVAGYEVATVTVSGIATPGCDGRVMKVTLINASDVSLAEQSVTLATPAADPTSFNFGASNVAASSVAKVAVAVL